jgi:superfamily II DNA or RNA helicase
MGDAPPSVGAVAAAARVPEQGQLVEVRKRQFVVAEVTRSSLPPSPLDPTPPPPQHLLTLTSIEDDALGEQLEVVWEIEPGARIIERAGLPKPDGFDDPERLSAFLHAVRWGVVTDVDYQALQSPFRAGVTIEDYQLDPVVRAIQMPRANLLIADDVGLGKTIEAGFVIQELILRHRARTTLIVVPASLQIKWRDEMRDKFGLEFRIVDTSLLRELRRSRGIHTNPWTHFPRLITSIDWLKRDTPMRLFRDVLPLHPTYPRPFDVLVVDEAHNVAPTVSGNYALDSQRTQAIRTLAPHFEHRLFLTATPHNGYQESFTALLELLDDQRFARGIPPEPERLAAVMVRRLKDDIVDWKGDPKFAKRVIVPIEVDYDEEEREIHAALAEYSKLRQAAAREEGNRYATEFVLKLLKKRLFSSPAGFAHTLDKHRDSLAKGPRRKEKKQDVRILRRAIGETEEEYADDTRFEDSLGEAVDTAGAMIQSLDDRERELLDQMTSWAERARNRPDSKAVALLAWLKEHIRPEGEWSDKRVIVFTEYRATQNWLIEILTAHDFGDPARLMTMYGGMDDEQREQVKAAFQASPDESDVRILLATDAASEGIDLQNHCNLMVHAEIPWNPSRLEQRNGRIDRHGQRQKEVLIHHFVGSGYEEKASCAAAVGDLDGDLEFLMRAAVKVEAQREDLGRVGPVIAEQVEEAMLGRRNSLDTRAAETQAAAARSVLKIERRIQEQIEKLHERLLESRKRLELTPENVEKVVEIGLELAGQPQLQPASVPNQNGSKAFRMPPFVGTWAACAEGLAHPHTGQRRLVTFDHELIEGRDDVVLVHLEHRLVQMCLRLLRAEIWAPDSTKRLQRVTVGIVPDTQLDTPAVVAHARLVVIGEDRHRLHEEIVRAGGVVRGGRFARLNVGQIDSALEHVREELPPASILDDLRDVWAKVEDPLVQALDARKSDRMQYLTNTLERRRDKEAEDMTRILEELKSYIEAELAKEPRPEQMELWVQAEREQLRRDVDALRRRIDAIPGEIEREAETIRRRYSDPDARLFPVAVTFLVPESMT